MHGECTVVSGYICRVSRGQNYLTCPGLATIYVMENGENTTERLHHYTGSGCPGCKCTRPIVNILL